VINLIQINCDLGKGRELFFLKTALPMSLSLQGDTSTKPKHFDSSSWIVAKDKYCCYLILEHSKPLAIMASIDEVMSQ